MDTTQRTIDGAAAAPLSNEQKQRLARVARRAFDAQVAIGLADGDFDTWRHAAVWEHLHLAGLRNVTQRGYGTLMRRFLELAGIPCPSRGPASRSPDADDIRRARHALETTLTDQAEAFGGRDGAASYAYSLFVKIHKTTLDRANARQIWQVMFTIKNRASRKTAGNGPNSSREPNPQRGPAEAATPHFPPVSRGNDSIPAIQRG